MNALVVDDSFSIRKILASTLSLLGFTVSQAANGKEALQIVQQQGSAFSIIVTDWHMPEMDGLELIQHIHADKKLCDIPVIMVTAETDVSKMQVALEAGAVEYLMKPFTKEMLLEKLRILGAVE